MEVIDPPKVTPPSTPASITMATAGSMP